MITKPKDNPPKKLRRWGTLALAFTLLIPGLVISGSTQTVEGAAYTHISKVGAFDEKSRELNIFSLDNGYKVLQRRGFDTVDVSPGPSEKYYNYYDSYGSTKIGSVYLQSGKLYTQKAGESAVEKLDDVVDFEVLTNNEYSDIAKFSYFALKSDGTVWAWGQEQKDS
ncbi:hypothetical protein JI735_19315 [Paenibacillus sonchi]|uniref:Copper amine oxidase-like N-terminal domain-containing protein n=1 Tax=Paenibacillus sonchi TaxID=373687 RepID=A0A974P8T2_9BACL|nr:hypothetical protein [Paenibacillus sonchi]QQZ58883.1 hypothetical protein JI735_19315 [Paenibacillus sonchi]